jgi:hypothetical protein
MVEGTELEEVRMTRLEGWRVSRILWARTDALASGMMGAAGRDAGRDMEIV